MPDSDDVKTPTRREFVRRSWGLLTPRDKRRFSLLVGVQMMLATLDLLGILLIGLVGVLAVSAIQNPAAPPAMGQDLLARVGLESTPAITIAVYAGIAAACLLILKSVLSTFALRKVFNFLALRQADVAERLTGQLFERSLTTIEKRTSQRTINALVGGTMAAIVVVLGSFAIAVSDGILLVVLVALMFVVSPAMTLVGVVLFAVVAIVLQRVLGSLAGRAGRDVARTTVRGTAVIQESVAAYRELTVAGTRSLFRDEIGRVIRSGASSMADSQFVTQVPRYVFETALVVGAMAVLISQMNSSSITDAVATMTIFLAGGSRIMPSILRLQVSMILIKDAGGRAEHTYELAADLRSTDWNQATLDLAVFEQGIVDGHPGFTPEIRIEDVSYTYPTGEHPVVQDVSLVVPAGSSLALVGSTGAGKSTLADLLLGVLSPSDGSVLISGLPPHQAIAASPGAIGYVPQSVGMLDGTVRENIAFGIPEEWVSDDRVWEVLERAHLGDFLRESKDGLETRVGERGLKFSGGQRQRLGIARALYTRPKLLVLDEATSALDAETEAAITDMLTRLTGSVTIVTIAHRLATVRNSDQLLFLQDGHAVAVGTFDEVRAIAPSFDRQANLLGL